eukprot:5277160-Prymnesium_polylepis.1
MHEDGRGSRRVPGGLQRTCDPEASIDEKQVKVWSPGPRKTHVVAVHFCLPLAQDWRRPVWNQHGNAQCPRRPDVGVPKLQSARPVHLAHGRVPPAQPVEVGEAALDGVGTPEMRQLARLQQPCDQNGAPAGAPLEVTACRWPPQMPEQHGCLGRRHQERGVAE